MGKEDSIADSIAKPPEADAEQLRGSLRVKPDVYMAALLDEVNEHLVELIDKIGQQGTQKPLITKFYTTTETAITVATPNTPNSPSNISDPNTVPPTPGYQAHTVYETLQRISPRLSIINDGDDVIYVISTSEGVAWTPENPILPGESRTFFNVYELRLRSPTIGDVTAFTGGTYRLTEYEVSTAYSGLQPSAASFLGVAAFGSALSGASNLNTILAGLLGLPMNSVFDTTTPLAAGATFFGTVRDFNFSRLGFMGAIAGSTVASAANGFRIQQSHDGALWDFDGDAVTTAAGVASRIKAAISARFARVAYTNGAAPQTGFRMGSRAMIA